MCVFTAKEWKGQLGEICGQTAIWWIGSAAPLVLGGCSTLILPWHHFTAWGNQQHPSHRPLGRRRRLQWVVVNLCNRLNRELTRIDERTPVLLEHPHVVHRLTGLLVPVWWERNDEPLSISSTEAASTHQQIPLNLCSWHSVEVTSVSG